MPSALKAGRPIRYRPSRPSKKPPECAGLYSIYDANGNQVYTGQAVNIRRRVYQHRRSGKIPDGGYVDCFRAKEGITYEELDATERERINKYNPTLNRRGGGGGRKSSKLGWSARTVFDTSSEGQSTGQRRGFLRRILGYERVDEAGEARYLKDPKAPLLMVLELVVKALFVATTLVTGVGVYLKFVQGVALDQRLSAMLIAVPFLCFALFRYIRRSKVFGALAIVSLVASTALYLASYPMPIEWPFGP